MSYLDINEFIEKTRRIIDDSDIFEFRSNVARLYIDKKNPQFVLKIKDENLLNEILQKKNPRDEIAKLLQHEIIKNISELLTEAFLGLNFDISIPAPPLNLKILAIALIESIIEDILSPFLHS